MGPRRRPSARLPHRRDASAPGRTCFAAPVSFLSRVSAGSDVARTPRLLIALLATTVLLTGTSRSRDDSQADRGLRLAVLPCTNIEATFRKFHPLLAHVKSATGLALTIVLPADVDDFRTAATHGRIDFALQDPHVFKQTASYFDPTSLLQTRAIDGSTSQSAVVVVRRDSGVTDLAQLRGKTVMFGPRTSSTKWVAARFLFESKGITVGRDVKVVNGGCCEDIAFAVSVRSVDAGTVCDHFLGQHGARQKDLGVDPKSLTVVGRTPLVPTRVFAARKGVAADVIERVARALLQLNPGNPAHAAILESAEASGFLRTTEAEYLSGVTDPNAGAHP